MLLYQPHVNIYYIKHIFRHTQNCFLIPKCSLRFGIAPIKISNQLGCCLIVFQFFCRFFVQTKRFSPCVQVVAAEQQLMVWSWPSGERLASSSCGRGTQAPLATLCLCKICDLRHGLLITINSGVLNWIHTIRFENTSMSAEVYILS